MDLVLKVPLLTIAYTDQKALRRLHYFPLVASPLCLRPFYQVTRSLTVRMNVQDTFLGSCVPDIGTKTREMGIVVQRWVSNSLVPFGSEGLSPNCSPC